MATAQRIKGQEVAIEVLVNGVQQATFSDVRSFSVTPRLEKKEEGYLGELTNRYDEIFNGVDFDLEVNFHDEGVLTFVSQVVERASRRVPGTVINIKARLNFPGGGSPKVVMQDCFFAEMPVNFGSRSDYGTFKLSGSCSNWKII